MTNLISLIEVKRVYQIWPEREGSIHRCPEAGGPRASGVSVVSGGNGVTGPRPVFQVNDTTGAGELLSRGEGGNQLGGGRTLLGEHLLGEVERR